ncbi:MAG: hypothetical protein K0R80_83 [Clostridia bacterium]|jgi:hypothetical protein|nr:hypothetical protein [Clostridia bacterium]
MKFTKGLFIGTALGVSAAMMMNNKAKNATNSNANSANNTNSSNAYGSYTGATSITSPTEVQTNDDIVNDII